MSQENLLLHIQVHINDYFSTNVSLLALYQYLPYSKELWTVCCRILTLLCILIIFNHRHSTRGASPQDLRVGNALLCSVNSSILGTLTDNNFSEGQKCLTVITPFGASHDQELAVRAIKHHTYIW